MRNARVCWPGYSLKSVLMVMLAVVLLDATPAGAKIAVSATPIWPPDAKVGDLVTAAVLVANQSIAPHDTEDLELASLSVTPSCAASNSPICLSGFTDPGVFKVLLLLLLSASLPMAVFALPVVVKVRAPSPNPVLLLPVDTSRTATLPPAVLWLKSLPVGFGGPPQLGAMCTSRAN